jgi:pyrroline-5-carboxylate reductase
MDNPMQSPEHDSLTISFIGGGNMATALIGGLAGKLTAAANLHVVEINPQARVKLEALGVRTSAAIDATVADSDVIILAVKPQQMREVAAQLKPQVSAQLVLSIAAGIRAVDLSRWLGGHAAIVRTMPNTPALIGRGITGMVAMPGVTPKQRADADAILRAVGTTVWLDDEALIDPVTALSGSGPAYVFYFIEAMQQAGMQLGLTAAQSSELAIATFAGAAQLAADATDPVSVLRERVTSKGGTTHAALSSMQESGVAASIVRAIEAAAARGRELGEEFGRD